MIPPLRRRRNTTWPGAGKEFFASTASPGIQTRNMVDLATTAPIVAASFLASAVEVVEAFTIVLAVSIVRGVRPAALGTAAALAVLVIAVAVFGPLLAAVPIHGLQLTVGILLLVFGLGWLRKAVLRAGGVLALHDESAAFTKETQALRRESEARSQAADWLAGVVAFKAVLLEGTEVVFIVLAVGARPGLLIPSAVGAAAACVLVLAAGIALRQPLSKIPENSLKFTVGALLTGFGVFWCCEGLGAPWPGGDWAILALVAVYLAAGLGLTALLRGAGVEGDGMSVLKALGAEIFKMFAADLWLTLTALAAVVICAVGLRAHVLTAGVLPFVLAAGVLLALGVGVIRGASLSRRK